MAGSTIGTGLLGILGACSSAISTSAAATDSSVNNSRPYAAGRWLYTDQLNCRPATVDQINDVALRSLVCWANNFEVDLRTGQAFLPLLSEIEWVCSAGNHVVQ